MLRPAKKELEKIWGERMATQEQEFSPEIRRIIDQGRFSALQTTVIILAVILNMLDGFDVTAMSFTVNSMGEQLGIPVDQLGIVFSVALAGMMLGALFIAPLSDRIGRRRMIINCVLLIGVSMLLTGWASNLWELILWRGLTGLGVGGLLASLAAISAEYTPEKYRSLSVMAITAGYPLGAMLGGYLAAPVLANQGWHWVYFYGGAITLLIGVAVFLMMPESLQFLMIKGKHELPAINTILQRMGRETLTDFEPPIVQHQSGARVFSLLTPQRRNATLILWASFFFCFISLYFMLSWIPKLVVLSGMSESLGVYASVIFNAGAIGGILSLGWLAARIGLSNLIALFLGGSAVLMAVFALTEGEANLFIYLLVIGFLLQGGFVGLYAVAAKIYPTEIRSTGVGWAIGLGRFGAVVGPYVGGLLIAGGVGMEMNFMIFAVPLLISGLIAWVLSVR